MRLGVFDRDLVKIATLASARWSHRQNRSWRFVEIAAISRTATRRSAPMTPRFKFGFFRGST